MPVLLHQQPVLTLALDSFQDTTIEESDIRRMWIIFTKCKDDIKNGFRLENISWRIWYKKYLNNTSDIFCNDKLYQDGSIKQTKPSSMVHSSVDSNKSNSSSFSNIEPIEVLKKCACGEQLISSSFISLSTPHSEYTCFDRRTCIHHQPKSNLTPSPTPTPSSSPSTPEEDQETSEITTTPSPSTTICHDTIESQTENAVVDSLSLNASSSLPPSNLSEAPTSLPPKPSSSSIPTPSTTHTTTSPSNTPEVPEETEFNQNCSTTNTNNSNSTNTTLTKDTDTATATIPPHCPTIEQFYQQQILLLQQVYLQKQQQLQYQKQQRVITQEQLYQHQMYLQQWYNQQQQQLVANCTVYYKTYLQQQFGLGEEAVPSTRAPSQSNPKDSNESTDPKDSKDTAKSQPLLAEYLEDEEEDYDEEDEDDDYFYSDEDEEEDDLDDDLEEEEKEKETIEVQTNPKGLPRQQEEDLFRKVSTPSLKNKVAKPSLLSALIKENTYNEYKKTVEIIQKYDHDVQKSSNNIYSIKEYNGNGINSLNKNERRPRAPSFEDVRRCQGQDYRKFMELHPLYPLESSLKENNVPTSGQEDVEEYYEKGPHHPYHHHCHPMTTTATTTTTTNNSYSTVHTMASQDSHCTLYSNPSQYGVYGSNKTNPSVHSTKSQGFPPNYRTSNNSSVNVYLSKKRINYSN